MINIAESSKWYLLITAFIGVMSTSAMDKTDAKGMKDDSSQWYGGTAGQSYFSLKTSEIINTSVAALKNIVRSTDRDEEKLVAYFEPHFRSLGDGRNEIATETETEDAPDFGLPRINLGETLFTPLSLTPVYAKWYDCFQKQLTSQLQEMRNNDFIEATFGDGESSTTITVMPFHEIMRDPNYDTEIRGFSLTPRPKGMAQTLNEAIQEGRLYFVKSQTTVLCDGTWVPGVAYITALYTENEDDQILSEKSIKTFRNCGVLAIHAKEKFVLLLVNMAAKIWKDALLCDVSEQEGLSKLKALLADFRYTASQLTYFKRGSAAIAEWEQEIVLKFHGLQETYHYDWTKLSVDLNALTLLKCTFKDLLKTFLKKI